MLLLEKKTKSGETNIIVEHFPASVGHGTMVTQCRTVEPVAPLDKSPRNSILVDTAGDGTITVLNIYPMSKGEAEAMMATIEAALAWMENPPPIEPPPEPLPDVMPVELSPYSQNIPEAGGNNYTFTVTSTGPGVNNTWSVDMDGAATWITLQSPPLHIPQTVSPGTVTYSVNRNSSAARTGNFYVNGKTFVVSQDLGLVEGAEAAPAPEAAAFSAEEEKADKRWFGKDKKPK